MTDKDVKDIAVATTFVLPDGPPQKLVPSYLVKVHQPSGNKGSPRLFISLDKPGENGNFIHVKGFFTDLSEPVIVSAYQKLIAETDKKTMVEMYFPWNSIYSIQSLVYKAK